MSELNELFAAELQYQEKKSNIRTLKCFFWLFAGMLLIWILSAVDFFVIEKWAINAACSAAVILMLIPLVISWRKHLDQWWVKYVLLAVLCAIVGVLTGVMSQHATLLYVLPLLFASQYRKKRSLWFVYGFNTVTMTVSSLFGFYHGLCDANLFIEGNHTHQWFLEHYQNGLLQITPNENPIFVILVFEVLPRSIILLIFTLIMRYIIISNQEDAERIADLTYRKEMDARTRLFNRNKFEEMAETYYPAVERVAVIFWDLNNLKLTNDTYGHAEGDALIEKLAGVLYGFVDERRRAYHIGGDEFLMVIDDPHPGETEALVAEISKHLEDCKTDSGLPVSSAVGYAEGVGRDIDEIKNLADDLMYRNKAESKKARQD